MKYNKKESSFYLLAWISFLTDPGKSFEAEKKTSLSKAFKYFLTLSLVLAVLSAIVSLIMFNFVSSFIPYDSMTPEAEMLLNPVNMFLMSLVSGYVGMIIIIVIWGVWLHLWAYLLGARKGLQQTMKSVFYGCTPQYLIGWIPVVNFITIVWSFLLMGVGLTRLQDFTGGRAAVALIIAASILMVIILAAAIIIILGIFAPLGGLDPAAFSGFY